MDSTTGNHKDFLKPATQIPTITLAIIAVLTTLGAVLVFVMHTVIATDVSPRLDRVEVAVTNLGTRVERVETHMDNLERRMDNLEAGQQQIIELLSARR